MLIVAYHEITSGESGLNSSILSSSNVLHAKSGFLVINAF